MLLLQWISSNRFLHPRVKALETRVWLTWCGPHAPRFGWGNGGRRPDWQFHQDYTQMGRINSFLQNTDTEPQWKEWALGAPRQPMPMMETHDEAGGPPGLSAFISSIGSQGIFFFEGLLELEYNTFFSFCFYFWRFLQIGLLVYVWHVTVWVPFAPKHYAGIIPVDQLALTQGHERVAKVLWCPSSPHCILWLRVASGRREGAW